MDPVTAGIILCIPRFFDAVSDLYIGNFSDNFRSRWGRRCPLIIAGATGCAILLPLFFMPPFRETMSNPWYSNGPFWFLAALGTMYYSVFYTLFAVPYTALGYELSDDYDEKTRILAWRMYLGLIGQMLVPWIYKLSVNENLFSNIQRGALITALCASAAILVLGIVPAACCRENRENSAMTEKVSFIRALIQSLKCKPFLFVFAGMILITSFFCATGSLNGFVCLYAVCCGNNELNATITGLSGTIISITGVLSLLLTGYVSRRLDKKWAFISGLGIVALSQLSYFITLTEKLPYLQLVTIFFHGIAMQGCWLMLDSMLADVCELETLQTGRHCEGIFSAVRSFGQKFSQGLMALISGWILKVSGFDAAIAQSDGLPESVLRSMKNLMILIPFTGCIIIMGIFVFYPITRKALLCGEECGSQHWM